MLTLNLHPSQSQRDETRVDAWLIRPFLSIFFSMQLVYITAGAAGMYCGSCMRDNTLANALHAQGHSCLLIPTYTPIRVDEPDASASRIFFGGISVYLEQQYRWLRRMPGWLDRLLSQRWLLRWVSRFAVNTRAEDLVDLTLSMLKGMHGHQRREIERLAHWLDRHHKPDVLCFTNVLLSGMFPEMQQRWSVPLYAVLQGDDIFLEFLPPAARQEAIELIQKNCAHVTGIITTCQAYADYMAAYLGLPRERMRVVYPGIHLKGYPQTRPVPVNQRLRIGYFARIAPEKGLHQLVEAGTLLAQRQGIPPWEIQAAGYLGPQHQTYLQEQIDHAQKHGWGDRFCYLGELNHSAKLQFLSSLDLFSVPTTYREPKGLYLLEAQACGVPAVQPDHGSFPELLEATQGGVLFPANNAAALADQLEQLLKDASRRQHLGSLAFQAIREHFTDQHMAKATLQVLTTSM